VIQAETGHAIEGLKIALLRLVARTQQAARGPAFLSSLCVVATVLGEEGVLGA